jgi:DNA-binding PucR family transcriptional regulator
VHASAGASSLLAEAAEALLDRFTSFQDALVNELAQSFPSLVVDEDQRRELRRSADTNLRTMLLILVGELPDSTAPAPEQLQLARSLSRRDVPLEQILESYRGGEEIFRRMLLDELAAHTTNAAELTAALRVASDQIAAYLSHSIATVIEHYQAERDRWFGRTIANRADIARRLLRGDRIDTDRAERALGYPLRFIHTGLLLWPEHDAPDGPSDPTIEAVPRMLAEHLNANGVLQIPIGATSAWAWLATIDPITAPDIRKAATSALPSGARLVAGRSHPGPAGFRRTHDQALQAQRVATRLTTGAPIVAYDDVELLALISHDETAMHDFIEHTLGDLAAADPATSELRDTLRIYLEEDANARRAAERLHMHKNTVIYRIHRAEEHLGRPIDGHRTVLAMALLAAAPRVPPTDEAGPG